MKRIVFSLISLAFLSVSAQEKLSVDASINMVSNYVWRGMDQNSGASLQPSLSLAYKGVSLTAWGSQSLTNNADRDVQEVDITLGYSVGGFTFSVADLWWGGLHSPYGYYKDGPNGNTVDGGHHLEATVGYSFEKFPLTLCWSTWVVGADARTTHDNRCYSTYVSASYPVSLPAGFSATPSVGFTPWRGYYHDGAAVTDISLTLAKEVTLKEWLKLPVFVQCVVSPVYDHVYLVGGLGLSF